MTVIGSIPLRDFGHEWRLVETQAPVVQPALAPILRAEVKRLSTCNRVVAGSNPALRPRGLGSSAVEHFFRFASPRSHTLRAEGLTVIQPRKLDEP